MSLTIVNNGAMHIGSECTQTSFQINTFVFFGYIPRSEIAESYGNSIFNFLKGLHYCSIAPSTFSAAVPWVPIFPYSPQPCYFGFFDSNHPDACEVLSHFSKDVVMLSIFSYACWLFV